MQDLLDAAYKQKFKPLCDLNIHGPNARHDMAVFMETLAQACQGRWHDDARYVYLHRKLWAFSPPEGRAAKRQRLE